MGGPFTPLIDEDDSRTVREAARAVVDHALDTTSDGWVKVPREDLLWLARAVREEEVWDSAREEALA